ncbi:MAG: NAD-dependent epimerase/dehydratase family protein [Deltaproteobacteria bacterium]|nr:NAD-dependent epimerase/dehydratase family protein [Deltaproteobacteria bacterium]MBW2330082.1 NAD-dependent epimerase/dehydratase family protein [Deltaproteobacteria bacterium]
MNILITGANGFIGKALCIRLASDNKVIGVYHRKKPDTPTNIVWEQADLTDYNSAGAIREKYSPAVVVHCAGLAHQKIGAVDFSTYMRANSEAATENLARAASKGNPAVYFIFLSSVSVYGEDNLNMPVSEDSKCQPSSDYAFSKLDAERRLLALFDAGIIGDLSILRLAPVYDRDWSFNLDRRVLAPLNMAYIRFGSGLQRMSALARPNLVDFIHFLLHRSAATPGVDILNVCDAEAYEFNKVVQVFKNSGSRPNRHIVSVPLPIVWLATRIAGSLSPDKRGWLYSCYDKLASSLVFDNEKLLKTGFRPVHSLETIFDPQITQISQKND